MQHEITAPGPLLDGSGNLREPGWARSMLLEYRRGDIKAAPWRIKEWDYYLVMNDRYGLAFTIADNSYMGLISASLLDFTRPWEHTETLLKAFPMGKYRLPESSRAGDTRFSDGRCTMAFLNRQGEREINCAFRNFHEGQTLYVDIKLREPETDSMVIATPFGAKKAFYYNQKINCMPASGKAVLGEREIIFSPEDSFGTLDWGRGVWTYDNTWYWGSGNGMVEGKPFGFNIGYGFGDTSAASENLVIYDGVAHKLGRVRFNIPEDSYLRPWTFTSDDGRFEMDFQPVLDRASLTNAVVIMSDQHQVFGRFSGRVVLDDGRELKVENLMAFAEKVRNKY